MINKVILIFLIIYRLIDLCHQVKYQDDVFYQKCLETIYQNCPLNMEYTEEEIDRARIYIQDRFMNLSDFKPVKPPCKQFVVRKNFKCLTDTERQDVMDVLRVMYDKGIIGQMAALHWKYWGEIHKFGEFIPWHRWFVNEFEKRMRAINPDVTLPYWTSFDEFDFPHFSMIWRYFGRSGDNHNDHCIKDGIFSNITQCVRREWTNDKIIPVFNPIEYLDSVLQKAKSLQDWFTLMNNPHFKTHLHLGGWAGQMSVTDAPYEWLVTRKSSAKIE